MTSSDFEDAKNERLNREAPVVPFEEFMTRRFRWLQGEHVAFIGPTNSGKTTVALNILPIRRYIVLLATKPRDKTLDQFGTETGFVRYKTWPNQSAQLSPRRLVWPDATRMDSVKSQKREFTTALHQIYREGGWCVYIDELWFIIHHLKMDLEVRTYLQQARSNDISLVVATQRPAFVPLEVYDQSTHLFFWRDNDERNLKRLSGIGWQSANLIRILVANLEPHQFLYINTRTGELIRSKVEVGGDKNARAR